MTSHDDVTTAWPVLILGALATLGAFAAWLFTQTATPPPAPGGTAFPLRIDGIGPVTIGMTRMEAERALGEPMNLPDPAGEAGGAQCRYGYFASVPDGVFMLVGDAIARIDVARGTLATPEGARIGSDEFAVAGLYGGRASLSPHKYADGHYLTVTSDQPAQAMLRYVFETKNGFVTRYRSGRVPEVEYVEGCS